MRLANLKHQGVRPAFFIKTSVLRVCSETPFCKKDGLVISRLITAFGTGVYKLPRPYSALSGRVTQRP